MDKSRYVQPDADYRNWLAGKIAEQVPNFRNTATSQMFALSSLEKMYSGLTACPCRGKSTPRADFEATGSYPGKKINKGEALVQDLVDAGWIIKGNYSNQETAMQISSDIIYKENHPTQVINRMPIAYTVLYLSNTKYR